VGTSTKSLVWPGHGRFRIRHRPGHARNIIKPTPVPNLYVVTTGQIPPNPSELLMHSRFEELLKQLSEQFDNLIVDAPPFWRYRMPPSSAAMSAPR
jgi:cellulose biosynthesis protein BcsQ